MRRSVILLLVLAFAAAVIATLAVAFGRQESGPTAAQAAALARVEPYRTLLEEDFSAALESLPDDFARNLSVSADGLSAAGIIGIVADEDTCAALKLQIGPEWLLDDDPAGVSVSEGMLVPASECTAAEPE